MTRILSLFVMFMLFGVMAFAQNRVVTGTVTDEKGNPVEAASITVVGTRMGTSTDQSGRFSLSNVPPNATIRVTGQGIPGTNMTASGNTVNFNITRSTSELAAVVVTTTLGRRVLQERLGAATAVVGARELTQSAPVNLVNGLTAKVPGLTINTTNSGVNGETRINFRGIRSLTGSNQPLLVVDGAQVSLGYLNSINPNDVENVSLLKSASAATIYGPDAVNGVIVITTKRGRLNRPQIAFSQSVQFEKVAYLPRFQGIYGSGYNQDANGNGTFEPIEQQSWGDPFDGSIRQFGQTGPQGQKLILPYTYQPNGRKNFFNTGTVNQTDVSYSTGDLFLSAQHAVRKGTVPGDENDRKTVTFRSEKTYNKFRAGFSGHYTNTKYDITTANTTIYYGITGAPGEYDLSRFSNWREDYFSSPDGYYTTYLDNNGKTPYFVKDNNRQIGKSDDFFGNVDFSYKATDWLTLAYRLGGTLTNANAESSRGAFQRSAFAKTLRDPAASDITAAFTSANAYSNRLTSDFFATFNKKFGSFGTNTVLGYSYRNTNSRSQSVGSNNLGFTQFLSIASRLGEPAVTDSRTRTSLDRLFANVDLDWQEKVFVQLAGSYDRDSRLAPPGTDFTNKDISLFYPGVNASVLIHKFFPTLVNNNVLTFFKIRGAYNKTGNVNAIGAYSNDVTFGASTFFPFGSTPGYTQSAAFLPRTIKPEYVLNREVGVELAFLKNNRITLEANYYSQKNTDQILNLQLSNTTGFTSTQLNAADFVNNGYEVDLRLTPLVKVGNVDINVKANYTRQTSEIKSLYGNSKELGIGNFNYAIVGRSAFVFKLPDYNRDPAGHVIVGADGMPTINPNLTEFGKTAPDNIVGLSLGVNWKQFSMAAVAEYRGGNQILVDQLGAFLDDNGVSERSAQYGRRAFIFPNSVYESGGKYVTNTDRYTQTFGREFFNSALNTSALTNYLADGSFWKLREVSLSYALPGSVLKGKTIKGVTFGITGRNLLMFVPKSNVWTDPEFSANGNSAYTGNATGRSTAYNLPPTRNFGASVSFQF